MWFSFIKTTALFAVALLFVACNSPGDGTVTPESSGPTLPAAVDTPTPADPESPVPTIEASTLIPSSGQRYTQVSAKGDHTCGLRAGGSIVCWGKDDYGQLRAQADERFTVVSAGGIHTCGLRPDGTAACWGHYSGLDEEAARMATLDGHYRSPFPPEDEHFTRIDSGGQITCGFRTDGDVACWDIRSDFSPFGAEEITDVSVGNTHVCGLRSNGTVVCDNFLGVSPPEEERFVSISTSAAHVCGLRSDGVALCWGANNVGQLGSVEGRVIGR